jgi:uncharacterized membrane protein YhfC
MLSISFVVSILIQLALPLGAAYWIIRRYKTGWKLCGAGVLAYLIYQAAQPVLFQMIGETDFYANQIAPLAPVPLTLVVTFLSALLEEAARTGVFWYMRKNVQEQGQALTVAAGHAGAEGLLIGLMFLIDFIMVISLTSSGVAVLNLPAEEAAVLQHQIGSYWVQPWFLPLAAGLQHIVGLTVQFALGVMVWQAVKRQAWVWLAAAVLWHTAMSATSRTLSYNDPDWSSTGIFILMGLVNGALLYLLLRKTSEPTVEVLSIEG